MDFNFIKRLVQLVDSSTLTELEIEEKETKIKISRKGVAGVPAEAIVMQHPANYHPAPLPQAFTNTAPAETAPTAAEEENLHSVLSPIVGTFYRASSPDAEPFVQVGDSVSVGTGLCIIEAMKLMNEIESDVNGKIVKILVENGKPVEYNQPLFLIRVD